MGPMVFHLNINILLLLPVLEMWAYDPVGLSRNITRIVYCQNGVVFCYYVLFYETM